MCRSHSDGGRRCSRANDSRLWRTKTTERLARNRRVATNATGQRRDTLDDLIERDRADLDRINAAIERYGECVTPLVIPIPPSVQPVLHGLRQAGLRPLLVGGSVRDSFDGHPPKDLDFEVYGGSVAEVSKVLAAHGRVDEVGKEFGVLKMRTQDGIDLDVSVPRRENKVGVGHRGFQVEVDPGLSVHDAAARRDFTVNAMSYDPELGVLVDPHHGKADLDSKVLRHTSEAFSEDPLRVLRGMQFASRYGMTMASATARLSRTLADESPRRWRWSG